MPYNAEPGRVKYVTASADVRHGAVAADDGYVGTAVKQATPAADGLRADRNLIKAGEAYILIVKETIEVPNTGLTSLVKGDLVYINTTTNALAAASGAGLVPLGKIASLPGERGTPAATLRVDLDFKS